MSSGESDLEYYSRRAMEESAAAVGAACPMSSASHRRMAAVYAIRMRDEQVLADAMNAMLDEIDEDAPEHAFGKADDLVETTSARRA